MPETCWHKQDVVAQMNTALPGYLNVLHTTPHVRAFQHNIDFITTRAGKRIKIVDIGCGTGMISSLLFNHYYTGCDLPHVVEGCAKENFPDHAYFHFDIENSAPDFIKSYDMVLMNALVDIMAEPVAVLEKVMQQNPRFIFIHRQEFSASSETHVTQNPSYGGHTWHSIINRKEFEALADKHLYKIVTEQSCGFDNWEGGGSSLVLEKLNSWSLYQMDRELYSRYFRDKKEKGFFVESGANDGVKQSNTLFFEHHLDWRGMLIEPVRELYKQCKQNRSPLTIIENYGLVSHEYKGDAVKLHYTPECYGLMSVVADQAHTQHHLAKSMEAGQLVKCKSITIDALFKKHKMQNTTIDLFVLDIEGYEVQALKGFTPQLWNVRHFLIEEQYGNGPEVEKILAGYYTKHAQLSEHDFVYVAKK